MQERQFSPFESDTLSPAERQALKRARGPRTQAFLFCIGTGMLALFAAGCPEPGDLQNPNAYPLPPTAGAAATGGGTSGGSSGSGGGSSASACETACMKQIFQTDQLLCKLCHNNTGTKLAMLDLSSDGYTARLKNVPATHGDLAAGMTAADCPTGDKLIDTATPANSWLLKKIRNEQGNCGTVMPSSGTLSADQKTCIETYVTCVAAEGT